ncbi:50S ribosomal protein L6 [candidate division TA06 bacterium DG_26]|uniref:Large ribosomal subunit protein uL6 n=1 Tax=candidate division TA06 bacterium DG_26 TaxID=1703771 RepID=A0A0S7WKI0_UNCT6|nr:MAG: 50S ribosomal protein L6 [candidate division TA06 bacterium DG_26]
MSRIGNSPVSIPDGVSVAVKENVVEVKGPLGALRRVFSPSMQIKEENKQIIVARPSNDKFHRSLHGLTRALIANMVEGVTNGFEKTLEIRGTGYRAQLKEAALVLQLGFSHPVVLQPPEGIRFEVPAPNRIMVKGIDKELVGQVAATIRAKRKAEPYKGKGIRYEGEWVRKKAGKTAV